MSGSPATKRHGTNSPAYTNWPLARSRNRCMPSRKPGVGVSLIKYGLLSGRGADSRKAPSLAGDPTAMTETLKGS